LADTFEDLQAGHLARAELKVEDARMLIQRGRNTQFESALVDAFLEVTRTPEAPPVFVDLSIDKLKPGMILARDLRSAEGQVLLAAGHALSADLIQRVGAYATRHGLSLEIAVRTAAASKRLAA
jgi:hypothetical protein